MLSPARRAADQRGCQSALSASEPTRAASSPAIFVEKNLVPTHPWHQDHSDEQEDGFQGEGCNDPRQIGSKPNDMENGIKSPSLRIGRELVQQHVLVDVAQPVHPVEPPRRADQRA